MDRDLMGSFDQAKLLKCQVDRIKEDFTRQCSAAAGLSGALHDQGVWDGQYMHAALTKLSSLFSELCEVQAAGSIQHTRGYAYHLHALLDIAHFGVDANDIKGVLDALKAGIAYDLGFVRPGTPRDAVNVAMRACAGYVKLPSTAYENATALAKLANRLRAAGLATDVSGVAATTVINERLAELCRGVANGEYDLMKTVVVVLGGSDATAPALQRLRELGVTTVAVCGPEGGNASPGGRGGASEALAAACEKVYSLGDLRRPRGPPQAAADHADAAAASPSRPAAVAPVARQQQPTNGRDAHAPVAASSGAAAPAPLSQAAVAAPVGAGASPQQAAGKSYSAALTTAKAAAAAAAAAGKGKDDAPVAVVTPVKPTPKAAANAKMKPMWVAPPEYSKELEAGGLITQTLYLTRKDVKTSFGYRCDRIGDDGKFVKEVDEDSAAANAGLVPTMQILEVMDRNELQRKLTVALLKVTRVRGAVTVWHKEWGNGKIKLDHKVTLKNTNTTFETVMVSIPRVPRQDKVDTLRGGGSSLGLQQHVEFTIYIYKKADEPPTISARDVSLPVAANTPFGSGAPPLPIDDKKKPGGYPTRK